MPSAGINYLILSGFVIAGFLFVSKIKGTKEAYAVIYPGTQSSNYENAVCNNVCASSGGDAYFQCMDDCKSGIPIIRKQ